MDFANHGSQTPYFSLNGMNMCVRVVDVYDGDTIKIVAHIFGDYFKFDARLKGIDTCEIRSNIAANKDLAKKARTRLFELVTGAQCPETKRQMAQYLEDNVCVIYVKCNEFDKYGRVIIECYKDSQSLQSFADVLKQEKLAYAYNGATKLTEDQQLAVLQSL